MQTMKRVHHVHSAAALFVTAAFLVSCAKTDSPIDESFQQTGVSQPIQLTATLAPKGEDNPQTRAITTGKDGENKEILNVTWKENEKIAIYYQKTDDTYATAEATVTAVDSETGFATISASLPDAKGGEAKFVYPASLANASGDIDEAQLLNNQNGLLRTGTTNISKNFDAATATGSISIAGSEATVSGSIAMQNRVCILKITLVFDDRQAHLSTDPPVQGGTTLTIQIIGGHTYTIASPFEAEIQQVGSPTVYRPFQSGDVIYVAMLPIDSQNVWFQSIATDSSIFGKASPNVTLEAGKFYRNVNVLLSTEIPSGTKKDLSAGNITAVDGDYIYQSVSGATEHTITIPDGASVTIVNVNINTSGTAGIVCLGNATITLAGTNSISGSDSNFAAIQAGGTGTTLTINGSGSLTAVGNDAAAIGSREGGICGHIVISGGIINVQGGSGAPAIGCGRHGQCGNITITDGVTSVTANKGWAPYCIGAGIDGTCGTITIGGTVYYDGTNFLNDGETYLATSPLVYPAP